MPPKKTDVNLIPGPEKLEHGGSRVTLMPHGDYLHITLWGYGTRNEFDEMVDGYALQRPEDFPRFAGLLDRRAAQKLHYTLGEYLAGRGEE